MLNNIQKIINNLHSNYSIYSDYITFPDDFHSILYNYESDLIKIKTVVDAKLLLERIDEFNNNINV